MTHLGIIKIGDLKIAIQNIEYDCSCNCSQYSSRCLKRHRGGVFIKLALLNERDGVEIVVGEGETTELPFSIDPGEPFYQGLSGCASYKNWYMTGGGWWSLKRPYILQTISPDEIIREIIVGNSFLVDIAFAIIDKNKLDILCLAYDEGIITPDDNLGLWSHMRPLLKTYSRAIVYWRRCGAELEELPNSFKTKFSWGEIKFSLSKGKVEFPTEDQIRVGKNNTITFKEVMGRKIVLYDRKGNRTIWEETPDGGVRRYRLNSDDFIEDEYFERRLGKIVFSQSKKGGYPISSFESLEKEGFKILKGEVCQTDLDGHLALKGPVILDHPQFGSLILPEQETFFAKRLPTF